MRKGHLRFLVCPMCCGEFTLQHLEKQEGDRVLDGKLMCANCDSDFPIIRGIPRFVDLRNYADGFDFQWNQHALTQHDSYSKTTISKDRFFSETRWSRHLSDQTILEIGCGSGRFTAQALSTGAMVVATDLSGAVDANFQVHQHAKNLLIIQSDLYQLPLRQESFDKLFCFGVLQHTPDVERSFRALPIYLKPGGQLAADVYDKHDGLLGFLEWFYRTYYWVRPITRRLPAPVLYRVVQAYVRSMWPLTDLINRIPSVGKKIVRMMMIVDYRGRYELTDALLKEWSVLDTFDMLSPAYDQRQTIETFRSWFESSPLTDVDVHYGHNGIEGRALKC